MKLIWKGVKLKTHSKNNAHGSNLEGFNILLITVLNFLHSVSFPPFPWLQTKMSSEQRKAGVEVSETWGFLRQ